jgi:sec-independent protein translocase protein TatC
LNLVDHLTELRDRLIRIAWILVVGTVLAWILINPILKLIEAPILPYIPGGKLTTLHPMEAFMTYMKVALISGAIFTAPLWLHQIWLFVAPGLYANERKYALSFVFSGTGLFLIGASFAYFLVLPAAYKFLLGFGTDAINPQITLEYHISFFATMILIFGIAFELPLALVMLGVIGIINSAFLVRNFRYALVLMAVVSAVVTPPDALSMIMLLVPLTALYAISIPIVRLVERKRAIVQVG